MGESVGSLMQIIIQKLNGSMSTCTSSIFKDTIAAKHLSQLHEKYSVVPAEKVTNNIGLLWVNRITYTA